MIDLTRAREVTPEVAEAVNNLFEYHAWDEEKVSRGMRVREALTNAYLEIIDCVPPCPIRTRALNNLVDSRMLANAAITHDGKY